MKIREVYGTEWIFWFNEDQKIKMGRLCDKNEEDGKTWMNYSVFFPILAYIFSIIINIILIPNNLLDEKLGLILNNGSLPIIAFGIITAAIPYLMEQIKEEGEDDNHEHKGFYPIRKRVMSTAPIFLLLAAGLFLFQSTIPNIINFSAWVNILLFILSVILVWHSVSIGIKMYVLQSSFVVDYKYAMDENRKKLNDEDNEFKS